MGGVGSGKKPRDYPDHIVTMVRDAYESGLTAKEIQEFLPRGYRLQTILKRYVPVHRRAVKRDQSGEKNSSWRGENASYSAVHLRLVVKRGRADSHSCVDCHGPAKEWAYEGGCPNEQTDPYRGGLFTTDLSRYSPRCVPCHFSQDRDRKPDGRIIRRLNGEA